MSKAIVTESKLTAIGNAIRSKTGGVSDLTLDEMATAIGNIQVEKTLKDKLVYYNDFDGHSYLDSGYTTEMLPEGKTLAIESISVAKVNSAKCFATQYGTSPTNYQAIKFTKLNGLPNKFTLGGWFYFGSADSYATPMQIAETTGGTRGYAQRYLSSGYLSSDMPSAWGQSGWSQTLQNVPIATNDWHNVACVADFTDTPLLVWYIDGLARDNMYCTIPIATLDYLHFGRVQYVTTKMTSLYIADSCLSSDEINELMTSTTIFT